MSESLQWPLTIWDSEVKRDELWINRFPDSELDSRLKLKPWHVRQWSWDSVFMYLFNEHELSISLYGLTSCLPYVVSTYYGRRSSIQSMNWNLWTCCSIAQDWFQISRFLLLFLFLFALSSTIVFVHIVRIKLKSMSKSMQYACTRLWAPPLDTE